MLKIVHFSKYNYSLDCSRVCYDFIIPFSILVYYIKELVDALTKIAPPC